MSGQEARGDPLNQGLPPELVDNMIQFCSDDRDTLCSLSLVCKSWLPLVQSYLFDRICIKPLPENERCDSVLKTLTIYYIQHVVLNLGPQREFTGNEEGEVRYLLEVVDRLKDSKVLKSLSIWIYHRPNFTPYRQLLEKLSSGSFRTILELKIYFGDLQDIVIADIIRFICSFPRLQALCGEFFSLVAPSNMVDSVTPVVQYTLPTSLNALRVWVPSTSDATDDLDKWFSSQSPRAVSELSISMTPSLKFPFYAASCSRCLRTLTLLLYPDSQSPGPYDYDLLSFKLLESLTIVSPSKHHHFVTIHRMLETISSSPRFRRLKLINVSVFDTTFREQLRTLDNILATEKFKDTVVEIDFLNILCKELEPCEQEVRSCLRKCFMQGRLEVLAQEITISNGRARKNQWWNGPVCL